MEGVDVQRAPRAVVEVLEAGVEAERPRRQGREPWLIYAAVEGEAHQVRVDGPDGVAGVDGDARRRWGSRRDGLGRWSRRQEQRDQQPQD